MNRQFVIIIFLSVGVFWSCSNNSRTIYLRTDTADGLTTDATVTLNGLIIGEVDELFLDRNNSVVIKLRIDNDLQLPRDTKFKIESRDLFGTKEITVVTGLDNRILNEGDTVLAEQVKASLASDSLTFVIKDLFESLTGVNKRDSILIELRRLNDNLERLEKENKN